MQILSFDSSGSDIQIALVQDGVIAFEESMAPSEKNRQESASMLLPSIDRALKQHSWSKQSLDLIVVGVGPGSFTGTRVSVITARTIGQALGLGVMPINSLELLACRSARPCVVVLNAGADKIYAAVYGEAIFSPSGGELLQPFYGSQAELHSRLAQFSAEQLKDWVLGEGVDESVLGTANAIACHPEALNLAAESGLLAFKRIKTGTAKASLAELYPWHRVMPLYLRSPSVTLKAEDGRSKSLSSGA